MEPDEIVTITDHIRAVLDEAGKPLRAATIIARVLERHETTEDAIRTRLSEMFRAGELDKPRYAFYQLSRDDDSDDDKQESIEARRRRVEQVAEGLGSQKELAARLDMSEARISKALNPELVSDRRLAPIERAISQRGLWRYAERRAYDFDEDEPPPGEPTAETVTFRSGEFGERVQEARRLASHRTIEEYDSDGRLLWAIEVSFLAGDTRRLTIRER